MKLYIGNKNYSSWSLRSWLLMRATSIAFEEVRLRLDSAADSAFKTALAPIAATGKVPVLVDDDGFAVWDTLAIAEYLAELHPQKRLWPSDVKARARARSLCAEMHSGFTNLRQHCPMNIEAVFPDVGARLLRGVPGLAVDLARLVAMWQRQIGDSGGPFLFGQFSIVDAYYAPVCSRIRTYSLPVPGDLQVYVDGILQMPAMLEWTAAALAENDFLIEDEPYRSQA